MHQMKKLISIVTVVLLVCGIAACGPAVPQKTDSQDTLTVVTTIFPEYDWVRNLVNGRKGKTEVLGLFESGTDMHSFQPSVEDILTISNCDLFIYVGGESDKWVRDALEEAVNPDMAVVSLLEALGDKAKEEELAEGMEGEAGPDDSEDEAEYDEHVWLSLRNAAFLTDEIAKALAEADSGNAELYRENAEAYRQKLEALDAKYQEAVESAKVKTLLFGDRFPFRYLVDDYGLDYYAAFAGCSAETEASFETIVFLADKVDELSLPAILTIEGTDHRIAETIRDNTASRSQQILVLDSMQSVSAEDMENGATYLSVMERNLEVLKSALE